MKTLLALTTAVLAVLVVEEKARELAAEAQSAAGEAKVQAHDAVQSLSHNVERQPMMSLLIAGCVGYALASIIPKGR